MANNEDISIIIKPDIKAILKGEKTIEEEVDFVNRFSTEEVEVNREIEQILEEKDEFLERFKYEIANSEMAEAIKDTDRRRRDERRTDGRRRGERRTDRRREPQMEYYEIDEDKMESLQIKADILSNEFNDNIGDVYFEGFDSETNFSLFSVLLKKREGFNCECDDSISNLLNYLAEDTDDIDYIDYKFGDLMQMRAYIRQLPSKYRRGINIVKLENLIDSKDETVLHQGEGKLEIDDLREGISQQNKIISTESLEKITNIEDLTKCDEASGVFKELLEEREQQSLHNKSDL